jgi:hypothetical protein
MILDGLLLFTGTSNGATGGITSTAYTDSIAQTAATYTCSNLIDLGVTSGVPTDANGGGARDIGVGDDPMLKLSIITPVAATSGGSATIQFLLEGAVDSSGSPSGTWTTMWSSPAYAYTVATAGAQLANVDVPRVIAGQAPPRFLRLQFVVGTATITAGTVEANIVIDRDDQILGTGGAYSGYPAGITVSN